MQVMLYADKVVLRNLTSTDWADFLSLHCDPVVQQYIRPVESEASIKTTFIQRTLPWSFESGEWLSLVIERVDNQEFVGLIGFRCDDLSLKRAEVGYLIATSQQGKGFATESLRAVIDWGALQYDMHKFLGICASDNIASQRVLKKVGFVLEGTLRQHSCINGTWFDDCYLGLLTSQRL
ncbi:GNAT family N-acetyltransferase [Shewanella ulleungensis]|uniref:N-acetyltransferase GCN5 n=1 Tax=Shewanella ulleungensis TaxID=2282699 RepID=A0ABQ2QIP1_9GAMM|nr:GNAT family N-acetyltransferase [Shewanella ulleungensis]MCL1151022.1 GNAT family N-acetyltransferase [Shewanella ulleungensis]GGP82399.1 N-acetyltransferase GCN5 [Shewanella ulleungensis]